MKRILAQTQFKMEPGDGTGNSLQDAMVRNAKGLCANPKCKNILKDDAIPLITGKLCDAHEAETRNVLAQCQESAVESVVEDMFKLRARVLLAKHPLYNKKDYVELKYLQNKMWWLGWCSCQTKCQPFTPGMDITEEPPSYLSVQFTEGGIFYILSIQIEEKERGKGHGAKLYEVCEELAWSFGCYELRQAPSGGYGEQSREDYLKKRGWEIEGLAAVKRPVVKKEYVQTEVNVCKKVEQERQRLLDEHANKQGA